VRLQEGVKKSLQAPAPHSPPAAACEEAEESKSSVEMLRFRGSRPIPLRAGECVELVSLGVSGL
jgi:hypothetical protein